LGRPWVGAEISVAQFQLKRELRGLDLSRGHGRSAFASIPIGHFFDGTPLTPEQRENAIWTDIDNAFSEPVTRTDDAADYVPTQILAEVFADAGYDAIVYKSQFGEKGYNIVLFNPEHADVINCAPYRVTGFEISFKEMGNRWFASKYLEKAGKKARTGRRNRSRK
jgi:RES domain